VQARQFSHLQKTFPLYYEKVIKLIEMDPDFMKICKDFEDTCDTVDYLSSLVKIPVKQMEKELEKHKLLLEELQDDISLSIDEEFKKP
jgi:hypothetical protein